MERNKKWMIFAMVVLAIITITILQKQNHSTMKRGYKYVRTAPVEHENGTIDYGYTSTIMVYDRTDLNGNLWMHYPKDFYEGKRFGTQSKKISSIFNDGNWISVDELWTGEKTSLQQLEGTLIHRIKPTPMGNGNIDRSFCNYPVILLSATKYHLIAAYPDGDVLILDCRYADPSDWESWQ